MLRATVCRLWQDGGANGTFIRQYDRIGPICTGRAWNDPEQAEADALAGYYLIRLAKDGKMRPDGEPAPAAG